MRRRVSVVAGCAAAAVTVVVTAAGCAHSVTGTAMPAQSDAVPDPDRDYGYVDNRCGLLEDSTVSETLDADEVVRPYSGAVCQYVLMRGEVMVDVTFSWFDTGNLERERTLAAERGAQVSDTVIERHPAFLARRSTTGVACSATAAAGSGVLSWWVQYRGQKSGDPCVDAEKLLSATLSSDL
ncbi:DUF3558 domain-containing protein [Mycolicibacterium monacense]|uniref:DUF3558 domain-containing protein n=1 Tax=Mycobacterium sp. (strain KMS) TaxID=189918 RepID=A1UBK5_MYCSK|nr:DUF3558 domain-containing protein [Mycolicibacterium monacense]OBB65408.1 hypothetical protein A6B34_23155 [Mycolicibacterium monacense]OBF55804.1 hypothetical protein A5778_08205 [Mycolicibacterium monacense]ORB15517.1 hypothetical protein BST34_21075 [Mycolicibacterium monacense DSM 44395]